MSDVIFIVVYILSSYLAYRGSTRYTLRLSKKNNPYLHVTNGGFWLMMVVSFVPAFNTIWALMLCEDWWPVDSRFSKWWSTKKEIK